MVKVTTLCAVAEVILARIIKFIDGTVKKVPGLLDLLPDAREIQEAKGRAILLNQIFQ